MHLCQLLISCEVCSPWQEAVTQVTVSLRAHQAAVVPVSKKLQQCSRMWLLSRSENPLYWEARYLHLIISQPKNITVGIQRVDVLKETAFMGPLNLV